MSEELLKKLRYKAGKAAVLSPPDGYDMGIEAGTATSGKYDFLLLFVHDAEDTLKKVPEVLRQLNADAVFWIAYPKQTAKFKPDINRDILAALVQDSTAYRAVSNVAIDDKWSALRFRPKDQVKSSK